MAANLIEKASQDIYKLETPIEVVNDHVAIANGYYLMGQSIRRLSNSGNDPVLALFHLEAYAGFQDQVVKAGIRIAEFINQNGIIVKENGEVIFE